MGIDIRYSEYAEEDDNSSYLTVLTAKDALDTDLAATNTDEGDYEASRKDFDTVDDENRMNLFNEDE